MSKYTYLFKNIALMTISNFASKILSFLLVPLYTSVLSTEDYGVYDLYTTTAFLLVPLLSGAVSQAALRFTLDSGSNPKDVFSISMKCFIYASSIVIAFIVFNCATGLIGFLNQFPIYFVIYYILCLLADILSSFARGLDKIADVAIAGILSSVTIIAMNILLLIVFPCGIRGYLVANCSAFAVSSLYFIVRLRLWRFVVFKTDGHLQKSMLAYSRPLIFDQVGWWINNVSNRYVVTWLCGTAANGIYAVAFKIPSILNVFQTIFNQAWTLSAVKELDEKGSEFYSRIYSIYNCGLVLICSLIIITDKFIAGLLYANDFFQAWVYAPLLTISVIFGCLSGVFEGIFAAAKETKILASSTVAGAVANILLSILLIQYLGPLGAAIATMVSYCLVWFVRLRRASKLVKLELNLPRDIISYFLLLIQVVILFSEFEFAVTYGLEAFLFSLIIVLYQRDVCRLIRPLKERLFN